MAPEVILSSHFNTKADVYAFGILMYEVLAGKRAYGELLYGKRGLNDFQFKTRVREGLRPEFDFPIKNGLRKMIESCWSEDPKMMPTFTEIYNKLSLSVDDYFLEFDRCYKEPKIIVDDEDEDEDEEYDSGLVLNKNFCLENVCISELLDYVDDISVDVKSENNEMKNEIEKIKNENNKMKEEMEMMKNEISEKTTLILSLQTELNKMKKEKDAEINSLRQSFERFFTTKVISNDPGILGTLNSKQKSSFDKLFVASLSSCDIYKLLVPDLKCNFNILNKDHFIDFEFQNMISINGIKVFSLNSNFPKSFDISVNGEIVKSINEAAELNGRGKSMIINFLPVNARNVRFINKGKNWDKNTYSLFIRGFEILSTESKYSQGVFTTLVKESENNDPHKCPIIATASYFDLNSFHLIDTQQIVCTYNRNNSWLQIELTRGMAIITGFCIKKTDQEKIKNYKIIATEDSKKSESLWTTLAEINEDNSQNISLLYYNFKNPSPPVKFVRIVSTGPNWNGSLNLKLHHFDIFGTYF